MSLASMKQQLLALPPVWRCADCRVDLENKGFVDQPSAYKLQMFLDEQTYERLCRHCYVMREHVARVARLAKSED